MTGAVVSGGAVLCAAEIEELCAAQRTPLMVDWDGDCLIGGKYDLRMGKTGLVLPTGRIIEPTDEDYEEEILLEPGETVFVSTREKLRLPLHLVGNMSIKGDLSRKGILSLTGLIVDPGYQKGSSSDGRLHFRLANLGAKAVVLEPGKTRIASIQFLRLSGEATRPTNEFPNIWAHKSELAQGLGFIEEIKKVKAEVGGLVTEFERQKRNVNYVVLAGMLVILATLLGVAISGLLSLGADSEIVDSAKNVIPDDSRGQILAVVLSIAMASIAACTVIALAYRSGASRLAVDERGMARREALRDRMFDRYRRMGFFAIIGLALVTAAIAVPVELGAVWWMPCLFTALVLLFLVWLAAKIWSPIKPLDVNSLLLAWQKEEDTARKREEDVARGSTSTA